ncbi:DUF4893 domain-containing protein [Sphingomonas mesophila]|uniref:DUF4893 domain-containing protein n=1 Tax=Sphingomonas mesophila TaxID=2303576 RepID=UPI000E593573|nr:DUF4893 domain-containing protein [Sphingomonas mesophila]
MTRRIAIALSVTAALLALAGCVPVPKKPAPVVTIAPPTKADVWQGIANSADRERIANVSGAWAAGLAAARPRFATAIREEDALLKEDAALVRPAPTPGSYSCRLVTLGQPGRGKPALERFKPFFCYVQTEGEVLTIVKQTGSQRPAGRLWDDDNRRRMVFLGSLALGSEDEVRAYGDDPKRDMAGIFERIGPLRWRLVIPWPRDGAKLQVFELTPVPNQPE